ncbi:S9 family peptidase [Fulvivirga sedimenti]|uniref:S9 family peptidase n=1 Tax=Fulvivirga sedimenti TaxID=2879465 RepID=A0A9X1KYS1_9BACT|nr:S9 family peptidase [Fulvivirga sedimenti]MCA6075145.1 S9 family peptidase [Fulvivirga sedimenti]MCA6076322.1 S9 family peptidase [Fulvivirga sedimenti]MCA6077450.1 S9 family peptidase [Fulvivirga sedimenti]
MTKRITPLVALLLIAFASLAQTGASLELTDIYNMELVSDPQISPDGSKIVYVRSFKDIMTDKNLSNLWIINSDGTGNRPLTTGNHNDVAPKWSHDGTRIVFKSNMQDDRMKLFMMWMDTEKTVALTNTPTAPGAVSWSRNDQYLAFNMFVPKSDPSPIALPAKPEGAVWNSPPVYIDELNYRADGQGYLKDGFMQLFVLSTDGGTPRQLTHSEHDHGAPEWSADGQHLYFSANLGENHEFEPLNSEIHRLRISDGSIETLTDRFGPDASPVLSPDGKKIAYTGFDDTFQGYTVTKLYVMNTDGSGKQLLAADLDRDIDNVQWEANGSGIYFQYTDNGNDKIGHVALTGKVRTVLEGMGGLSLGRPYNASSFSVSTNNRFAFTLGGPDHPADLAIWNKGEVQRLTHVNDDLFSFRKIGQTKEIRWKSSYDQREIQGWVVTPPDFDPSKKYPLILEIHGGPFASYGSVFSAEIQLYAAAGYVVLYTNPRGSTGYGQEFGNLIHHDYPNHDYDDLMSGVDAVISQGYVDSDQLFVTGGSGGGVLSAWIVGRTDRFRAAVVAKPVINWYSFVLYADGPGFFYQYWFDKKPWEDPESYLKRSPLSYVGNVKTPTMLLTGEQDFRTPIPESEQFYAALKIQKVETALVRIPNASHGIANRPSNLVAKVAAVLYWFDKYRNSEK